MYVVVGQHVTSEGTGLFWCAAWLLGLVVCYLGVHPFVGWSIQVSYAIQAVQTTLDLLVRVEG